MHLIKKVSALFIAMAVMAGSTLPAYAANEPRMQLLRLPQKSGTAQEAPAASAAEKAEKPQALTGNLFQRNRLPLEWQRDFFDRLEQTITGVPKSSEFVIDGLDYPFSQAHLIADAAFEYMFTYPQYFFWCDTMVGIHVYANPRDSSRISRVRLSFGIIDGYRGKNLQRKVGKDYTVYWGDIANTTADERNIARYGNWAARLNATPAQKAALIDALICSLTDYDYTVTQETDENREAFQLAKVFRGERVVCEGYAKAFKYLCDRAGVNCAIVRGDADRGDGVRISHAWNSVEIDGEWYLVDSTNNDEMDGRFLLIGADDPARALYFPDSEPQPVAEHNLNAF